MTETRLRKWNITSTLLIGKTESSAFNSLKISVQFFYKIIFLNRDQNITMLTYNFKNLQMPITNNYF